MTVTKKPAPDAVDARTVLAGEIQFLCRMPDGGMTFLRVLKVLKYKEWPGTWNMTEDELKHIKRLMTGRMVPFRSLK